MELPGLTNQPMEVVTMIMIMMLYYHDDHPLHKTIAKRRVLHILFVHLLYYYKSLHIEGGGRRDGWKGEIFLTQYPDMKFAQGCSRVLQQQFGWKPRRWRPMPMSFILLPFLVIVVFLISVIVIVVILLILVTFVFKWSGNKCPILQAGPYFWHGESTDILTFVTTITAAAWLVNIFSQMWHFPWKKLFIIKQGIFLEPFIQNIFRFALPQQPQYRQPPPPL